MKWERRDQKHAAEKRRMPKHGQSLKRIIEAIRDRLHPRGK